MAISSKKKAVDKSQEESEEIENAYLRAREEEMLAGDPQNDSRSAATAPSLSFHQDADRATLKRLFSEYDEKEEALTKAKKGVEEAMAARSEVLKKIKEHAGPGPYKVDGQMVKIVQRGETLFLRGKGKEEAIEV